MEQFPPPSKSSLRTRFVRIIHSITLFICRVINFVKEPFWWKSGWGIPLHYGRIRIGQFTEYDWRMESAIIGLFISHMEDDDGLKRMSENPDEIRKKLIDAYEWFSKTRKYKELEINALIKDFGIDFMTIYNKKQELKHSDDIHIQNIVQHRQYLWT